MLRNAICGLLLLSVFQMGWAQPPGTVSERMKAREAEENDQLEETYESRIKKSELYGMYIPKDLADAFVELNKRTEEDGRIKFKNMTEADARQKLHFSLGRWMTHNWGFFGGSRLTKYLNDIGLYDPDDMARFIIITYHRELNNKPLGVKELIEEFQEMRLKEREERLKKGKVIHQETRKRPTKENNE